MYNCLAVALKNDATVEALRDMETSVTVDVLQAVPTVLM
jgi:hypothetical protein